jgi:hypothetical protein
MIEVLKQMQEALREYHYYTIDAGLPNQSMLNKGYAAFQAGKQAIAELESQEPVAWMDADGNVSDNNDHKCFPIPLYTQQPQRTEQNFCPRCGKRTNDIHTCTPPQNIEQDLSEQGRKKSAILGNNIEEMVNNGLPFLTALDTALKVYDHHTPRLHQPQRTWVGLTADEIWNEWLEQSKPERNTHNFVVAFTRAIEAKLKELNG